MAKNSKKQATFSYTTPRGVFVWPKIAEPDYGTKEFPKPDGEYSLKLRMPKTDAEAFVNRKVKFDDRMVSLQELYDEAIREGERQFAELKVEQRKKLKEVQPQALYNEVYDQETEQPTGDVEFKFKRKASGEYKDGPKKGQKWHAKPDLFDARGKAIGKGVNIWGGSEGKVSGIARPYFVAGNAFCGLTLNLNAVQVIELVSNGTRSADSYGFGEEEGFGYDPDDYREEDGDTSDDGDTSGGSSAGEDDF